MPRVKKNETVAGQAITCPACASSVSSDGRVLHAKSGRLAQFEKDQEVLDTLEKMVKQLELREEEKDKQILSLQLQLKEANIRLEEKKNVVREEQRGTRAAQKQPQGRESGGDEW